MFTSLCGLGDALLVTRQQHSLQTSHFRSRVGQHTVRYSCMLRVFLCATQQVFHFCNFSDCFYHHCRFSCIKPKLHFVKAVELCLAQTHCINKICQANKYAKWLALLTFNSWCSPTRRRYGISISSKISFLTIYMIFWCIFKIHFLHSFFSWNYLLIGNLRTNFFSPLYFLWFGVVSGQKFGP